MKLLLSLTTVLLIASPAFAKAPMGSPHATVTLAPVRGSSAHGMATLTQRGSRLVVAVKMTPSTVAMAAHIHRGSCPNPEKQPVYKLHTVTGGSSMTTLSNVTLDQLTKGSYTISVHKSATDTKNPVACGDIKP